MIAFFRDLNGDHEVQRDEIISLSLGPNVQLALKGDLAGDVVSNFVVAANPANETIDMNHAIAGQGITSFSRRSLGQNFHGRRYFEGELHECGGGARRLRNRWPGL